jgi:hypothetical protein
MANQQTDQQLIKRARYGARNVTGLSILATILAMVGWVAVAVAGERLLWIILSWSAVAVAARRGDTRPLAMVAGIMTAQFLLSLVGLMVGYLRSNNPSAVSFAWLVVPVLTIVALARNHSDLLELKRRGLWEGVFEIQRPSVSLSVIGGLLFLVAIVSLYAAILIPAIDAARFARSSQDFISLVRVDDKEFLEAIANASHAQPPTPIDELPGQARRARKEGAGNWRCGV